MMDSVFSIKIIHIGILCGLLFCFSCENKGLVDNHNQQITRVEKPSLEVSQWVQTGKNYITNPKSEQDYVIARDFFEKATEKNSVEAMYYLAMIYEEGLGVLNDYNKSLELFMRSADLGYAPAQFVVAGFYEAGVGVEIDFEKSFNYYLKSANLGYAPSQFYVANLYAHGNEIVTQNNQEAIKWYSKAAAQKYSQAQLKLGEIYMFGLGVDQDYAKALDYLNLVSSNEKAQYYLGEIYYYGLGEESQDYHLAFSWFKKSAEQGFSKAESKLGDIYLNGLGVAKDVNLAMNYYEKAAIQGEVDAQYQLARQYAKQHQPDKAMYWMRESAEAGYRLSKLGIICLMLEKIANKSDQQKNLFVIRNQLIKLGLEVMLRHYILN